MTGIFLFVANSVFLGFGLAMDAFTVCIANGLHEPRMSQKRLCSVASVYAAFQFAMPVVGWVCVRVLFHFLTILERLAPWISFALLLFIGAKMIYESVTEKEEAGIERVQKTRLTAGTLLVQGVATSIDALSVGFTLSGQSIAGVTVASLIIAAVTFVISTAGLLLGKKAAARLPRTASAAGGIVLIIIGTEILARHLLAQ